MKTTTKNRTPTESWLTRVTFVLTEKDDVKLWGEGGLINQVDDFDMVVIAKGVKSQEASRNYNQVKIQLVTHAVSSIWL